MIQNMVGNHLLGEWPTKHDLLLEISLNTQPLEEMNFKWDFCGRTSVLMNLSCLVGSDIQLIALITSLFTGNYPHGGAGMGWKHLFPSGIRAPLPLNKVKIRCENS